MNHLQCNEATYPSAVLEFDSLEFLAAGKSGIVYGIDEGSVLKEYYGEKNEIDVERRALERLGSHANIVQYLGATHNGSIILERGQPLRTVLQQQTSIDQIPLHEKLRWVKDIAEGIRYLHENDIIHADIGCHNMISVQGRVKLIDFEGCSIDGEEATSGYEWFSYQESTPAVSQKTDIFAYGCAVYEIITGRPPNQELATSEDRRDLVKRRYAENHFPEITDLPLGTLMQGCWHGTFNSMGEVLQAFEATSLLIANKVDRRHKIFSPLSLHAEHT